MSVDGQDRERRSQEHELDEVVADRTGGSEAAVGDQATATAASHAKVDDAAEHARVDEQQEDAAVEEQQEADAAAAVDPVGKTMTLGGVGHVWIKGDTPWKVSESYYGEGKHWRKIKAANAAKFKKGLREGVVLDIPPMEVDTLVGLLRFKDQPSELRALVTLMPHDQYEGFFATLTPAQIDKHGEFLQVLELMRATGKTVKELAAEQREFLQDKADAEGKTIGESVGGVVKDKGYGGSKATFWNSQSGKDRRDWKHRFDEAVKAIRAGAPADVKEIIETAEKKGGGFRWAPKEVEENHAFAYTYDGSWALFCGVAWVKAAETDPTSVHGNIAHEMGGHNYYGNNELGYAIQKGAMTAKEEKAAEKSGNSLYSTYGYMETEIFAELYEFPYNFPSTKERPYPSDTAFDTDKDGNDVTGGNFDNRGDVTRLLKRMKEQFAPNVAAGLVASLARRVDLDPRIVPMAKERFHDAVRNVFVAPP